MEKVRKKFLRVHGSLLIIGGVALTINASIGTYNGIGIFKFLGENHLGLVGLFQAYLLMSVIGIVLLFGSFQQEKRKWHLIGALAHVPPLAANILFWNLISGLGMSAVATFAVIAHCIFISVELFFTISKESLRK